MIIPAALRVAILAGIVTLATALPGFSAPEPTTPTVPRVPVVLKLDDLNTRGGSVPAAWRRVTDLAREKNFPVSIGLICDSFEHGNASYFDYIKEQHATGRVEFWFHGWDHRQWEENGVKLQEFKGTSYEHQKEHFVKSQTLAREKLGFSFTTFGAPFNATDAATNRVLSEDADIRVFLYGKPSDADASGKVVLERVGDVNIENPLFVPDSAKFIAGYLKHAARRKYFVIQGHPPQWDEARWAEFVKIIEYLQANQIPIVNPAALAASLSQP